MRSAGVRRLVYVSSVKALGERSRGAALRPQDDRRPEDAYGQSMAEADNAVLTACADGLIEAVIVRPVLVHGPGAKGNLQRLLGAIARGRALPLGSVRNRRSLVGVENLASALLTAATAPPSWPWAGPGARLAMSTTSRTTGRSRRGGWSRCWPRAWACSRAWSACRALWRSAAPPYWARG